MKSFAKASLFIAALMMGLPAVSTAASAKTCKSYSIQVNGDKKWTNISARVSARLAWSKHVKKKISWKWRSWALARNKSYSCWRVGTKWRCKAKARPCKL